MRFRTSRATGSINSLQSPSPRCIPKVSIKQDQVHLSVLLFDYKIVYIEVSLTVSKMRSYILRHISNIRHHSWRNSYIRLMGLVIKRRNLRAIPLHSAHCAYPSHGPIVGKANQPKISLPHVADSREAPAKECRIVRFTPSRTSALRSCDANVVRKPAQLLLVHVAGAKFRPCYGFEGGARQEVSNR